MLCCISKKNDYFKDFFSISWHSITTRPSKPSDINIWYYEQRVFVEYDIGIIDHFNACVGLCALDISQRNKNWDVKINDPFCVYGTCF